MSNEYIEKDARHGGRTKEDSDLCRVVNAID